MPGSGAPYLRRDMGHFAFKRRAVQHAKGGPHGDQDFDQTATALGQGPRNDRDAAQARILATQQEGYISGETLRRLDNPEEFLVISNWQSLEDWQKWLSNRQRKELQSRIDTVLGRETTYEVYQYGLGGF